LPLQEAFAGPAFVEALYTSQTFLCKGNFAKEVLHFGFGAVIVAT
jgi:hypothetical protein